MNLHHPLHTTQVTSSGDPSLQVLPMLMCRGLASVIWAHAQACTCLLPQQDSLHGIGPPLPPPWHPCTLNGFPPEPSGELPHHMHTLIVPHPSKALLLGIVGCLTD